MADALMIIRGVRDQDLPWGLRTRQRWRGLKVRARDVDRPPRGVVVRLLWAYFRRQDARRPAVVVPAAWAVHEDLAVTRRLLGRMLKRTERGERGVQLDEFRRWTRGPEGVKFLDETGGVTYQTLANDVRAMADTLDGLARRDRCDDLRYDDLRYD